MAETLVGCGKREWSRHVRLRHIYKLVTVRRNETFVFQRIVLATRFDRRGWWGPVDLLIDDAATICQLAPLQRDID